MRSPRTLRGNFVQHGVQFHVFVGGLLAVQAGVLENDPKCSPGFIFVDCGIESVQLEFFRWSGSAEW